MAQTWAKFKDAVAMAQEIADHVEEVRNLGRQLLDTHDGEPFSGAGDNPTPAWCLKDSDGNIKGKTFTPAEYLQVTSFVREFEKFMTNQAPGTGWWNGILAHATSPQK